MLGFHTISAFPISDISVAAGPAPPSNLFVKLAGLGGLAAGGGLANVGGGLVG